MRVNRQPITKLRHGNVPPAELRLIAQLMAPQTRVRASNADDLMIRTAELTEQVFLLQMNKDLGQPEGRPLKSFGD